MATPTTPTTDTTRTAPGHRDPNRDPKGGGAAKWVIGLIAAAVVAIVLFFAFGGDADVDTEPGDVDLPAADVDVDAPDIDAEAPDVDVDPGSVDVEEGDAEAEAEG